MLRDIARKQDDVRVPSIFELNPEESEGLRKLVKFAAESTMPDIESLGEGADVVSAPDMSTTGIAFAAKAIYELAKKNKGLDLLDEDSANVNKYYDEYEKILKKYDIDEWAGEGTHDWLRAIEDAGFSGNDDYFKQLTDKENLSFIDDGIKKAKNSKAYKSQRAYDAAIERAGRGSPRERIGISGSSDGGYFAIDDTDELESLYPDKDPRIKSQYKPRVGGLDAHVEALNKSVFEGPDGPNNEKFLRLSRGAKSDEEILALAKKMSITNSNAIGMARTGRNIDLSASGVPPVGQVEPPPLPDAPSGRSGLGVIEGEAERRASFLKDADEVAEVPLIKETPSGKARPSGGGGTLFSSGKSVDDYVAERSQGRKGKAVLPMEKSETEKFLEKADGQEVLDKNVNDDFFKKSKDGMRTGYTDKKDVQNLSKGIDELSKKFPTRWDAMGDFVKKHWGKAIIPSAIAALLWGMSGNEGADPEEKEKPLFEMDEDESKAVNKKSLSPKTPSAPRQQRRQPRKVDERQRRLDEIYRRADEMARRLERAGRP